MKLWIDDVRPAPEGYFPCLSVNDAKKTIQEIELLNNCYPNSFYDPIELIDLDYDSGDYVKYGGDYVKLLDWLEETGRNYPIRMHSMNPVGVENMRRIIERNGWTEVI